MTLDGAPFAPTSKAEAEAAGVHIVQQELNLLGTLSVAENLFLNRLPRRWGFIRSGRLLGEARRALAAVGLNGVDPRTPVSELGVGHQQLVEVAAALARSSRLLVLDEPTAALTGPETETLFRHIERLRRQGVGLVYISHRLNEIRRIADRVTVLRDGRVVETQPAAEISVDRAVRLMVGRDAMAAMHFQERQIGSVVLRVNGLCRGERVRDVSFEVRQGEIFGIAGLVGSGRTELLLALYGADPPESGSVAVGDAPPGRFGRPRDAVRAGIGLVPEDRKQQGLLLAQPIRANVTLARMDQVTASPGWIAPDREHRAAERFRSMLDIRCTSTEQPAGELSGGNQQKVIVARWLMRDARVLLFDEPTRGIDVGAKETVYRVLNELATGGKALVVVSSETEELMAICDRIAVLSAGRLVATFRRGEWSQDRIMAAAFSGYAGRANASSTGVPPA